MGALILTIIVFGLMGSQSQVAREMDKGTSKVFSQAYDAVLFK